MAALGSAAEAVEASWSAQARSISVRVGDSLVAPSGSSSLRWRCRLLCGKVIAVVQQSDVHVSCAAWLKGIWVPIAFPVPLPGDSCAASSACSRDTEIVLLSRQSASVRDPNEQ